MGKKYYAAFIISDAPIDLNILSDDKNIRHLVNTEFDMDTDFLPAEKRGGWMISKSAPDHCATGFKFTAEGSSISVVIANWFRHLFNSMAYMPLYKKRG